MHQTKLKYESKQRAITQKKVNKSYSSCALHSPLRSIHPQNFITIASIVWRYAQDKIQVGIKKRTITQNLGKQELWFMCTALPLDEIYPPTKFHNHSFYSLGDMHWTKFKYFKKKQKTKGNYSKTKQARVTVHVNCTPSPF